MRMIDFFDRGARNHPDAPCLVAADGSDHRSYAEVRSRSNRIANALIANGFEAGAHGAVLSGNDMLAFDAILGVLRADGVWVLANHQASDDENVYLLDLLDVDVLFFRSDAAGCIPRLRRDCPKIRRYVSLDGIHEAADVSLDEWLEFTDDEVPQRREGRPEELAFLANTGGTTGRSKGVMLTNLVWQSLVASLAASMPMKRPPVNLAAASMTHAAGSLALASMALGGTVVVLPTFDAGAVLEAIERHRVTYVFLPPTAVYMLLAHPDARRRDLSSLDYISYAGAPMSLDRLKEAIEVFGNVMNASFGQVECPMCVTAMPPHQHLDERGELAHPGSCGQANLLSRVEIMDDEGNILPAGENGEVVVRGPLVMAGYYKDPEATQEVSRFGWHHTGDIGYRDEQGWFYIVDRKKDMIISGGFNVYPAEVEQALQAHPAVQDCAVFGIPDEKWGEQVIAVVEPRKDTTAPPEDELIAFAREKLGSVKTPKQLQYLDRLPRSTAGKVLRAELRKPYWEGRDRTI